MTEQIIDPIDVLTHGEIERIARLVLSNQSARLDDGWRIEKIGKSVGVGTVGIYHVTGACVLPDSQSDPWGVVLKALDNRASGSGGAFITPDREIAAYRSGLFDEIPGGLRLPELFAIDDRPDGATWIWMEDLTSAPLPPWSDDLYVHAARHVGGFNGSWFGEPLPKADWLQVNGFESRVRNFSNDAVTAALGVNRSNPLMIIGIPPKSIDQVLEACEDIPEMLRITHALPQTICHLDCHPKNLFPIDNGPNDFETVAVDWSSVGSGPIGVDIGLFIGSGLRWQEMTADRAARLRDPLFDAYLDGLRESGWSGDPDHARFGYMASLCNTGLELATMTVIFATGTFPGRDTTPDWVSNADQLFGMPLEEWLRLTGENQLLMRDWHDEMMALARRINV